MVVSNILFEYPQSLSNQAWIFTSREPETRVCGRSTMADRASWLKSQETSCSSLTPKIPSRRVVGRLDKQLIDLLGNWYLM